MISSPRRFGTSNGANRAHASNPAQHANNDVGISALIAGRSSLAHSDPETGATCTIATIFSQSAQQLGLRPHGLSFWRLRGGSHLASSPIGRIGAVVIVSSPSGINCGATCSAVFALGSSVALTPTPNSGHTFGGWGPGSTARSVVLSEADRPNRRRTRFPEVKGALDRRAYNNQGCPKSLVSGQRAGRSWDLVDSSTTYRKPVLAGG